MKQSQKKLWQMGVSVGTAVLIFLAIFAALNSNVLAAPQGSNPKILVNEFYRDGNLTTGNVWTGVLLIKAYRGDNLKPSSSATQPAPQP
ncbi:MAG: hypothetical protein IPH82_18750 [Chloroflexi bacterium]|nr:hypothetical protein [Chloroflexota bacterium]